eukprot:CAMPEP_0184738460 /NCGR_PEP_ID=MMETSP0315-20130426/1087_1 /TAXON_ID=101924 /ORGANISM="Rhodosorus marinus, Strain UTEX LB 2760" /LENGTH=366 /DNA_ID=CAMNT_0027206157 /DNA_START=1382 /DNA_END=2480 /DNA_ORIENTATION=-
MTIEIADEFLDDVNGNHRLCRYEKEKMGPYALLLFVVVAVQAVAQAQDCFADPLAGAFEFSEFCRPLRNRGGIRFGQVCTDTKLNDKNIDPGALFLPSCIRAKFRADDGYELNLIRAGAHFGEIPTEQDRFTSRRNIDRWKTNNGVTDSIRWARVLICPEELQGQTDCCGQSVGLVASAVVSKIGDGERQFRVSLSAEDNDDLCTTRDSDNTTACDILIACPPCEALHCRGPGGVCEEALAFECPIGEEPFIRDDEFCGCSQPTPTKLTCSSYQVYSYTSAVLDRPVLMLILYPDASPVCDFFYDTVTSGGGPCNQPFNVAEGSRACWYVGDPLGCPSCSEVDFISQTCPRFGGVLNGSLTSVAMW